MTKYFVGLLFLAACSQGSQLETEINDLPENVVLSEYDGLELRKGQVFSGNILLEEGDVLKGQRHGVWTTYYPDGKIRNITSYLNGAKQGPEIGFDNSGYVSSRSPYVQGNLHGEFRSYNRGMVTERKNYSNDQLNGLVQKYYQNGKIMEESTYVDGTIDGEARWYDQEGNLSIKYFYDMGELIDNGTGSEE